MPAPPRSALRRAVTLDRQRGGLLAWVPVCLGIGIGAYFSLGSEPSAAQWWSLGLALAAGLAGAAAGLWRSPVYLALLLIAAGFGMAGLRSAQVAGPVLGWRYYGPVEGRVVTIDRSGSDKMRLTLDRVVLERMAPDETPERVRISLHGAQEWVDPLPGMTIIATAFLGPPEGPTEPGGFDFRRMAWFKQLGAVGYTRSPALMLEAPGAGGAVGRMRLAIGRYVQSVLPGEIGAFAAAITTGDRSSMDAGTLQDLRDSNLAHLLAISGLHMGLLTGFVFGFVRLGLALIPGLALTRPIKSWAAAAALGAGAFYLILSGGNVATQRAFIMAAVMLFAVMLNRRALTLRAVAVAAVIVLVLRPEALTEPGFQMSFAATTGLVAVFRFLRDHGPKTGPAILKPVAAVVISSAVAGLATAPYAAAHFNQSAQFGLLANVISVPLMGAVVMPAAVVAACLAPLGLAWIGLKVMAPAIAWVLGVAHWVAGLENAVMRIPSPSAAVLPLFTLGALWLILWVGRARLAGLAPMAAALLVWSATERPALLVSSSGGLVGLMTEGGRVLNKPKGDGFSARSWLENDGDTPVQESAARRSGMRAEGTDVIFDIAGTRVRHLSGRGASDRAIDACESGTIVILRSEWAGAADRPCHVIDEALLSRTGALAIEAADGALTFRSARQEGGTRPWTAHLERPDPVADLTLETAVRIARSRDGSDGPGSGSQSRPTRSALVK